MILTLIGSGVGAWALGMGAVATIQRRIIFRRPTRIRELPAGPWVDGYEIEPLALEVAPGTTLEGWRSLPRAGTAQGALLYFGGRGENTAWAPHMSSYLRGWSVVAFNYRGFGASTGRATEKTVTSDAMAVYERYLACGRGATRMAIMGRSLGTAVALHVARHTRPRALVLVSPLCSVQALVQARPVLAPAGFLLRYPMDALSHAGHVACPALVLVADADRQVPNAHSLRLAGRLAGRVTVKTVSGVDHRSLPRSVRVLESIAGFVAREA